MAPPRKPKLRRYAPQEYTFRGVTLGVDCRLRDFRLTDATLPAVRRLLDTLLVRLAANIAKLADAYPKAELPALTVLAQMATGPAGLTSVEVAVTVATHAVIPTDLLQEVVDGGFGAATVARAVDDCLRTAAG